MPLSRIQTDALQSAITSGNILDGTIQTVDVSSSASGLVQNSFRNKIINGDMRIDQRNAGVAISNGYTVDRFQAVTTAITSHAVTSQQVTDVPTGQGFKYSMKYITATAATAYGAGARAGVLTRIEGYNTAEFDFGSASAKTVTISFWVKSTITGTYSVCIYNSASDRAYPATYTINAANTWENKTVTITGCPDGTWEATTNRGFQVEWCLGADASRLGTANTWNNAFITGATGNVRLSDTLNAAFWITGVQLEKGVTATPFEFRPIALELNLCRRYCQYFGSSAETQRIGWGGFNSATSFDAQVQLTPPMRVRPTALTVVGLGRVLDFGVNWDVVTVATLGPESAPTVGLVSLTTTGSTAAQGDAGLWGGTAVSRVQIYFEAEL